MAFSTIYPHKKIFGSERKRSEAVLKRYSSVDPRIWKDDKFQRSLGLQDVLTRDTSANRSPHTRENTSIDEAGVERLLQEIKQKDDELDRIHSLYKATSRKLKEMEGESEQNLVMLRESRDELKRLSDVQTQSQDKETIRALEKQLEKFSCVEGLIERLQQRADEADRMEHEISALKRDFQNCGHGSSGDKIKITPSLTQCAQCEIYRSELHASKALLEVEERRNVDSEAERNFMKSRLHMLEVMEAELILYKTKYEECECMLLNLRELLVAAEISERKQKKMRDEMETIQSQLEHTEATNIKLTDTIERLDRDIKERDIYIEAFKTRLSRESESAPKEGGGAGGVTIGCDSDFSGRVQSIVKKFSNGGDAIACKCGLEGCKCALLASSSMMSASRGEEEESIIETVNLSSRSTTEGGGGREPVQSEFSKIRSEIACEQLTCLQMQNDELCRETERLREQLAEMSDVVSKFENHRASNCQLECEIIDLKSAHTRELETLNAEYRATICQKIGELRTLERQLAAESQRAEGVERKLINFGDELQMLREFRKRCEKIDECHCERLQELENFQSECARIREENQKLRCQTQALVEENNNLKTKGQQHNQRNDIKRSVVAFKRHYDEKVHMITCYEEKIKRLEAENESLRCFRDKFLLSGQEVVKRERLGYDDEEPMSTFNENYVDELCSKYRLNTMCEDETV